MDMDEDDDLYQPEEPKVEQDEEKKLKAEELEEGEEEDESGAMDEDDDDDSVRDFDTFSSKMPATCMLISWIAGYRHHHRAKRWHKGSATTVCRPQARRAPRTLCETPVGVAIFTDSSTIAKQNIAT
jgi:hypothetical protein